MKKYGVVIVSYDTPMYKEMDMMKFQVFQKENIPVFTIYNGPKKGYVNETTMYVEDDTMNPTMYNKFIMGCEHLLKNGWDKLDYIVRVNSSTFLNPKTIQQTIETLPTTNCYAGMDLFNRMISGLYIIISTDLLKRIVNKGLIPLTGPDHDVNDDVALGYLMGAWDIQRTILPVPPYFENCTSVSELSGLDYDTLVNQRAIRIKNVHNRDELDLYMWRKLTQKYLNQ